MSPFHPFLPPNPLYPRASGGAVAEGMKKGILINSIVGIGCPPIDGSMADFLRGEDTVNLRRTDLQDGLSGHRFELTPVLFVEG